ncbi:MAG: hypothetical protein A3H02_00645 [Candidatus Niyogibacteria bacterium RIFCSPLOWO2_12_FULL_41_13]|uniref:Uncharacterized protein n=1 Tax=Candidatus Niyogibacteria bacterium RIFCSPLOWO2_12_FULL_41_13 TaxID=1801726 RepID=A0A1G2F487_9BACT|nr:MAG: hypothetical protein A3D22_07425 [Deltaproteobacteria bacterium RIFCSPHIGHO2_02_FULL_44_53]OGZ32408.1 MAG: hypothetical protein A3H02_00645 [Candidatus Niyogibacteria bacterium RIFCSPLOWO2_12_FULL_41_13]
MDEEKERPRYHPPSAELRGKQPARPVRDPHQDAADTDGVLSLTGLGLSGFKYSQLAEVGQLSFVKALASPKPTAERGSAGRRGRKKREFDLSSLYLL